jgi:TfoX/Sxy family transcriptional regulator of competence genes
MDSFTRTNGLRKYSAGMRFDKSPDWLISLFDSAVEGLPLQRRKMFGYPAGFANGQMCCGLFGKQFFLRLGESDRGELLRIEGASAFDPMGGRPMREYVVLPDSMLEEQDELQSWLVRSIGYTRSLPPRPIGGKSSRRSGSPSGGPRAKVTARKRTPKNRRPKR